MAGLAPVTPPVAGADIEARLEALLGALAVAAPAAALAGAAPPLIVGGFPQPGHVLRDPPRSTAARLAEYTFAR